MNTPPKPTTRKSKANQPAKLQEPFENTLPTGDKPNSTSQTTVQTADPPATEQSGEPATTTNTQGNVGEKPANTTKPDENGQRENVGDVTASFAETSAQYAVSQAISLVALAREGEGRAACWERLRKTARSVGMPRGQGPGTAYEWATIETERLFPPPPPRELEPEAIFVEELPEPPPEPEIVEDPSVEPEAVIPVSEPIVGTVIEPIVETPVDSGVSGLGDLPADWGTLPANAQLQVEISWVSANRLRVRSGSGVDLSRALSPAPSYSALSWLETSILFPSKFADISVKATAQQDDEREGIRREKLAIEEIRGLLAEMLEG